MCKLLLINAVPIIVHEMMGSSKGSHSFSRAAVSPCLDDSFTDRNVGVKGGRWTFFTARVLACHSRKKLYCDYIFLLRLKPVIPVQLAYPYNIATVN